MPATTRSHAKQSHISDFTSTEPSTLPSPTRANTKKRAAPSKSTSPKVEKKSKKETLASPSAKKPKQEHAKPPPVTTKDDKEEEADLKDVIIINRAPVLDLWASCVTHFLHPDLEWKTCLSAGSAISALCAVVKGRSIGTIAAKSEGTDDGSKKKREEAGAEEIMVMGFNLQLRDGMVVVGEDTKKDNEEALKKKFGPDEYEKVKGVFENVLNSWKDDMKGLDKRAFGFYELFRPNVAAGQKGWGRKGELNMSKIQEVARKDG